jgi:hypothetical protein
VSSIGDRAGKRLSHDHVMTGTLAQAQQHYLEFERLSMLGDVRAIGFASFFGDVSRTSWTTAEA